MRWYVSSSSDDVCVVRDKDNNGAVVCSNATPENGRLISAAPDLYDALDRAENFIQGFEDDDCQDGIPELLADIRKAILKAKPLRDA